MTMMAYIEHAWYGAHAHTVEYNCATRCGVQMQRFMSELSKPLSAKLQHTGEHHSSSLSTGRNREGERVTAMVSACAESKL